MPSTGSAVGVRVLVLGRPGSGKGTQCARLAARLRVPHISTGDLFRAAVERDTPLARMVRAYVEAGELVPDDLVVDLVDDRLGTAGARAGFVLDGFPRTIAQAEQLADLLDPYPLDLAIDIVVSAEVARVRLQERKICGECGRTTGPSGRHDRERTRCGVCGGVLRARADDVASTISRRLALHDAEADPILAWLADHGVLVRVDGHGTPDEVGARIVDACARVLRSEPVH